MNRRLVVGAVVIAIALAGLPAARASAAGSWRYVGPTGSDAANDCTVLAQPCATIGHAFALANPSGENVQLEPGTYSLSDNPPGTGNVFRGRYLRSDPDAGGNASNTIIDAVGSRYGVVTQNVWWTQGITIRNAERDGLYATGHEIHIVDMNVSDNNQCRNHPTAPECGAADPAIGYGAGISLYSVTFARLRSDTASRNGTGIMLTDEANENVGTRVHGSTANDNAGSGIALVARATPSFDISYGVKHAELAGNTTNGNGGAGVLMTETAPGSLVLRNSVEDSTANDNGLPGITVHTPLGGGQRLARNTLRHDGLHGWAGGGAGDQRAGVRHTTGILMLSGPSHGYAPTIHDNDISDVFYGIWVSTDSAAVIRGNRISVTPGGTDIVGVRTRTPQSIVGIAATPAGDGYTEVDAGGGVYTFGAAQPDGDAVGLLSGGTVVGIAAAPPGFAGPRYFLVSNKGDVFSSDGPARWSPAVHLAQPIVGIAAASTSRDLWSVAADGGVFTYNAFYGSAGGLHLNRPIVGMAPTPTGHGYWLVASDGGIFSYGDAHYYGSPGGLHLNQPIVAIAATPTGHGYWLAASDGGIFSYGDAHYYGSPGGVRLNQPVAAIAATPSGHGYWLAAADGGIFSYGDAHYYGSLLGRP